MAAQYQSKNIQTLVQSHQPSTFKGINGLSPTLGSHTQSPHRGNTRNTHTKHNTTSKKRTDTQQEQQQQQQQQINSQTQGSETNTLTPQPITPPTTTPHISKHARNTPKININPTGTAVVNLSSQQLTRPQVRLLRRGIKFIPAPRAPDPEGFRDPLEAFKIRLRLENHFNKRPSFSDKDRKFRNKSNWNPPLDPEFEPYLTRMTATIENIQPTQDKRNLPATETRAIKQLTKNKKIVIKPADKGASVVVMDKKDYLGEVYRQLGNPLHYRQLEQPKVPDNRIEIDRVCDTLLDQNYIDAGQHQFIRGEEAPRSRLLYTLPKIHKIKENWPGEKKVPPGRPIVSDCSSESYNSAKYIDYFLAPLAVTHESYIKDTGDFLRKVRSFPVPEDAYLATIDVDALYTNINNRDGIEAVQQAFQEHPDPKRPDQELIDLLRVNLEGNDFVFFEQDYLQTHGTSMGKLFAPHYADIFMAHWEKGALSTCPIKPLVYLRFLDDIFIIWRGSREQFEEFLAILNNHHESIKLKAEFSDQAVNFLDTTVFKGNGFTNNHILDTQVYFKPTDTSELLHTDSYHPPHTFKGIVKSQLIRVDRISSDPIYQRPAEERVTTALKKRGYTDKLIRKILSDHHNKEDNKPKGASQKCTSDFCRTCRTPDLIIATDEIRDRWGQRFPLPTKQTCTTTNGIYRIHCDNCQQAYVGETGGEFRTRIHHHRSDIRTNKKTPIGSHFNGKGCEMRDMRVTFLEHFKWEPQDTLPYDPNKARRL